ncbi:TetR/AcrR family transcriptional regulator [Lutibacter sp. A80]|uniref:TetR/AcrR family transcriptional regulator n=1 Tax=Lutibacter sp. A80 TaxID=2918453 RepID=UPI001F06AD08|nr:TetR/AcrR family transcriptional regulator [Lutibacter sp. A80]UMB59403.1 TetR/AcrR family transcriptional regulator [Lutibacter sp. A80]
MKKEKNITTETSILNAAKSIFERKGMDGARMQEIADAAGINKALLHYYYRNKQLLFEAVFKSAFLKLAPQLNEVLNSDASLNDKIKGFTKNYISFIINHPYLPNFIINELNRSPEFVQKFISEKHFPNIQKFKQQVTENVNDGKIRPIKAEQLFINIMALNIFPFVAAPLLKGFLSIDNNDDYRQLMEERTTEVSNFIINALKV